MDEGIHEPTMLGWIARVVSLAFLTLLAGIIVWQITLGEKDVAFTIEMKSDEIRYQSGQFLVPLAITNTGSRSARDVNLEINVGDEPIQLEIELIGQNETINFVVAANGKPDTLQHRIISYEAS